MKKLLLILSIFSLSACSQTALEEVQTDTENLSAEATANLYEWEEKGIYFELPEGLMVKKLGDYLILSEEDLSGLEGEIPYGTIIVSDKKSTIDAEVETYRNNPDFISEQVTLGGRAYNKISFYGDLYEKTVSIYLIDDGENLITINEVEENKDQVQIILKSLQLH